MREPPVTVEPVESRTQLRRFADIPYVLHHEDRRWSPGVRAWEQWRLDARRHPYFDRGDAAFYLARRAGQPVGRIAAHISTAGATDGWFGFFDVPDDDAVTGALLEAAQRWLAGQGASSMTGPVSWTPDEDFGVPVAGTEHAGVTGLPWRPAWYAEQLRSAGLTPGDARKIYRLDIAADLEPAPDSSHDPPVAIDPPAHAGRYADRALVLDGIAAVPDVSAALAMASVRNAWKVARDARTRAFDTAVCVRCDGDPAIQVPRLQRAVGEAGYRWLLAPWAPSPAEPERVHQVFSREW